jgi:hypothetical protein
LKPTDLRMLAGDLPERLWLVCLLVTSGRKILATVARYDGIAVVADES